MPKRVTSDSIKKVVVQMRDGDIKSFMVTRKLMDEIDFIELSETLDEKSLSTFFLGRCFLEQVISNLAADSMFEFPPKGTKLEKHFIELTSNTGSFFYEVLFNGNGNYSKGIDYLSCAIKLYYEYLREIKDVGEYSDLGNQEKIWKIEEMRSEQI